MKEDGFKGLIHELYVDDLESARATLLSLGCEVLRWKGKGQDCYIKDPFGVVFNLWENRCFNGLVHWKSARLLLFLLQIIVQEFLQKIILN